LATGAVGHLCVRPVAQAQQNGRDVDPKKALYFVLQVTSDNPDKWSDNKEVKRLTIAAPSAKK
jgi:hypothetical protein